MKLLIGVKQWFWALSLFRKLVLVAVLVLLGWLVFFQFNKNNTKPQYQTATAERGTLITSVTASGIVSSVTNSTITTQATGVVSNVYVINGDYVQQGQNIATIALDSTSQQKQAATYASYLSAQNTLNTAQAKINSLQSALFKANQNFVNDKGVNNPSDQQKTDPKYVEENADWLQAEADYKNQQGVIAQAQSAVSAAWLSYTQTAANITAPISGYVENLAITPGFPLVVTTTSNNNNSPVAQTVGNIKLKGGVVTATVNLIEIDVTKVKVGQKVTMTLDAFNGKTFTGKVGAINTNGVVSSGVTTYPTTIAFDSAPTNIYPNMGVTATIITNIKNNVIMVQNSAIQNLNPGAQTAGAIRGSAGVRTLTNEDAKAIQTNPTITTISNVSPETTNRGQVTTGRTNTNVQVIGATPSYLPVHKIAMDQGSFITEQQVAGISKVAVLGPQVVADLFDGANPIGQTVRVQGQSLVVIGTTVSKGGTGFFNQDNIIFVPLSTAQKQLFGQDYLSSIALEAKSLDVMVDAQNQVGYLLLARHKLFDPAQADFSIFSQSDILSAASSTTQTFTTLLAGIAAISLLVGGIGIMNIMLVTVTERVREIGLRKALGARKKTIIRQFLIEAVILTFIGGVAGILLGVIVSLIILSLMHAVFVISFAAIFLAIGVSGGIGILFGWYPAQKAANLQPIEALRYE